MAINAVAFCHLMVKVQHKNYKVQAKFSASVGLLLLRFVPADLMCSVCPMFG